MRADDRRQPGKLRASRADRRRAAEVLGIALREGRLDALEHDNRSRAAGSARTVGEVDALLADLPRKLGVRDWTGHLRIRLADREVVTRWLTEARTEGRLSATEHDRRLAGVAAAVVYADLAGLTAGIPGPPGNKRDDLLVSTADRQTALDRLSQLVIDEVLPADEHAKLQARVHGARRYRDLDRITVDEDERVSPAERARTLRRLDEAHAAGRLDAAEHDRRVAAANAARLDSELDLLLTDLTAPAGSLLSLSGKHRLSDAEREQAVQELQHALDDGRLTQDEYDDRVRAASAITTVRKLRPLLADLIEPEPAAATPATRPKAGQRSTTRRRRWLAVIPAGAAAVVAVVVIAVVRFVGQDAGDGSGSGAARPTRLCGGRRPTTARPRWPAWGAGSRATR